MTHIYLSPEVITALGLSISFMGIILSIVAVGISFFAYKISFKKAKQYLKMAGLMSAWVVFLILNSQTSSSMDYVPSFLVYSTAHLISIFIGMITLTVFLSIFSRLQKVFDKKWLIIAGIFAGLGLLMRIIFPFFGSPYLSLIQRIIIIMPPLMGLFMIIKSHIKGK